MLGGIITDACVLLYEILKNHHNLLCLLVKNGKVFYATTTLNLAATGEAGAIQNLYFNVPGTHDIYMGERQAIAINTAASANVMPLVM